jgi:L-asparaginase
MKQVAVYFTGGTISMKYDPSVGAAVPALSGREILDSVRGLDEVADVEVIDFARNPGPHWTLSQMMELSLMVKRSLSHNEIEGVVVTHGTDTLEETAYLLDLTIADEKPVVFVGAMRNSSEMGWDGPPNLLSAIRVAVSEAARGLGVLVSMNETILAAGEATKTHTEAFDSFQSPDFGPLGVLDKGEVIIRRRLKARAHLDTEAVAEPVFLIKTAAGTDSTLIEASLAAGAKGLVVEGLGRGNVPPACVDSIKRAIARGIPTVLVSRCPRGRVYESYGYEGGGKQLRNIGMIFADFLNGQKARVKLAVALGAGVSGSSLASLFSSGSVKF